jgi:glycyl-tRNA synthetase
MQDLKQVTAHCKEYGFIYQSSEIYDGLGAVYDYGPNGVELKNNIKQYWWQSIVNLHANIVGIDAAIFMHPTTWHASGHVEAFNDPLIDNKDSKKRYRADQLIEGYIEKLDSKIQKEIEKGRKRFGDDFDEEMFTKTHPRVVANHEKRKEVLGRFTAAMKDDDMDGLKKLIEDLEIADPESGSRNWTEVRKFNLMFSTQLGNIAGEEGKLYLRPETAQGIFTNFLNVQKTTRQRIPFGIAQIGKAFRNEIVARQFIFRMREFEQMEMQYFVKPGTEMEWYEYWRDNRLEWHRKIGLAPENLRFHEHDNLAHYANAALDIEFQFPFGFRELEGIHSRTDFDLAQHQKFSGKKLTFYDPDEGDSYVPYVVETSIGCDRMFLAVLSQGLEEEEVPDAKGKASLRTVLKLHPYLAPVKVAILPLLKNKEELTKCAGDIFDQLKTEFNCQYDEKDAIGRRYRRQDAIGTPFCVTVDFQTIEDSTVTLRNRDTLAQDRVPIDSLSDTIAGEVSFKRTLAED